MLINSATKWGYKQTLQIKSIVFASQTLTSKITILSGSPSCQNYSEILANVPYKIDFIFVPKLHQYKINFISAVTLHQENLSVSLFPLPQHNNSMVKLPNKIYNTFTFFASKLHQQNYSLSLPLISSAKLILLFI